MDFSIIGKAGIQRDQAVEILRYQTSRASSQLNQAVGVSNHRRGCAGSQLDDVDWIFGYICLHLIGRGVV